MKSLVIQLEEPMMAALNRIAATGKRQRSEFVRQAIRKAIREAEDSAVRQAYAKQPDSGMEADDWSNAEEYQP